jgi:hypothetical protein
MLDIQLAFRLMRSRFYRSVIFLPLDLPEVMVRIPTNLNGSGTL